MFLEDSSPRQVFNEFLLARQVFPQFWLKNVTILLHVFDGQPFYFASFLALGIIARTFSSQSTRCVWETFYSSTFLPVQTPTKKACVASSVNPYCRVKSGTAGLGCDI